MMQRGAIRAALAAATLGMGNTGTGLAAEGGSSHYLPGSVGDLMLAVPPEPGFVVADMVFVQSGSVDRAVLSGRVDLDLDADVVLNFVTGAYTVAVPALGGTYTAAIAVPFGFARLRGSATGPGGRGRSAEETSFNISDLAITPVQLNWNFGLVSLRLSEMIVAPTGDYDLEDRLNLGRNYWSFDTLAAVTWFNPAWGTEVSVAPGIMVNTENAATDYQTGHEFHVDFTATQFLSPSFAFGLRGYYYKQVTGDGGRGAVLGDFQSESLGLGPGLFWSPEFADGKLLLTGKYLHDLSSTNRFGSDYGLVTAVWKL